MLIHGTLQLSFERVDVVLQLIIIKELIFDLLLATTPLPTRSPSGCLMGQQKG